jgi:hypothetical protein
MARWQIKSGTDELILDIFEETPVESGFLDSIVLSVVLLRSGYSLGDSQAHFDPSNPLYVYSAMGGTTRWRR